MHSKRRVDPSMRSVLEHTLPENLFSPEATKKLMAQTVVDDQGLSAYIMQSGTAEDSPQQFAAYSPPLEDTQFGNVIVQRQLLGGAPDSLQRRYALGGLLGRGANGFVYSVEDRDLQREIAAKIFIGSAESDPKRLKGFLQEARITASLEHPNILPVYDIGISDDKRVFFTMRRVRGLSLGEAIRQSAEHRRRHQSIDSFSEIVRIFLKVCDALEYAHSRGIIHQDVKPDNIMLGEFGEVLLLDWGSYSASCSPMSGAGCGMVGTPAYMSPEQARREPTDIHSDVYCLGASFFHALTLRHPTWAEDADQFWEKKRRGEIDPLADHERARCPIQLLEVALKALEPHTADRYQSVTEFAADLKRYQEGQAVSWRLAKVIHFSAVNNDQLAREWQTAVSHNWSQIVETPLSESGWSIVDGKLRGVPFAPMNVISYARSTPGDMRVIWKGRCLNIGENMNCFIAGEDRQSGYTFHIGALGSSTYCMLTKAPAVSVVDYGYLDSPLRANDLYEITVELESGVIRLFFNDKKIIDYRDPDPLSGPGHQSFGFETLNGNTVEIETVAVYYRPLPATLSPLAIANSYYDDALYEQAIQKYAEIRRSYPHDDLAAIALYKTGLCHVSMGNRDRARDILRSFESQFPHHELIPYALLYRASLEKNSIQPHNARSTYAEIARRFPGHAVAKIAMAHISSHLTHRPNSERLFRDPSLLSALEKQRAILHYWLKRFGIPLEYNRNLQECGHIALQAGQYRYIFKRFKDMPKFYVKALVALGKHDQVLKRFPDQRGECATILLTQYRFEELLHAYPDQRYACAAALRKQGKLDIVLERYQDQPSQCAWCLIEQNRGEEALKRYSNDALIAANVYKHLGQLRQFIKNDPKAAQRAGVPYLWLHEYEYILRNPRFDIRLKTLAMIGAGRAGQVLAELPGYPRGCCQALINLGRAQEALDRYGENIRFAASALKALRRFSDIHKRFGTCFPFDAASALISMGESQRVLDTYPAIMPLCAQALLYQGRFDEIAERYPRFQQAAHALLLQGKYEALLSGGARDRSFQASALIALGRFDEVIESYSESWYASSLAMIFKGEESRLRELRPHHHEALAIASLLRGDYRALQHRADDPSVAPEYLQSRYMAALDTLAGPDPRPLVAALTSLHSAPIDFHWYSLWFARFVLPPAVEAIYGATDALRKAAASRSKKLRYAFMQQPWYALRFIAGAMSEEEFSAQPCAAAVPASLRLCRGVRAEIDGDRERAARCYDEYLGIPVYSRPLSMVNDFFVRSRLEAIRRA